MKSNSYLDDDELEFYVINYLIKEEKKGRSWIRDLMGLKVDCELSLQSVKVFKMKKEIKSWVRISHPKLHPPSLNRIRKKILDLQELGGKKEQPTGHRYFHGNVSFEGKAKLVNHWDRIRKKRNDKKRKETSIYFENIEKKEKRKEVEKRQNSQKTNEDNYSPEPPKKTDFMLKMEKKEKEEERLILYFNKKLKKIKKSKNFDCAKVIKKLSKLTPSSDDKKTIYTDIDVDQKWDYFIYTIDQFCE